ncbi:MAG: FAD-binding oxidoreductase [Candidatus Andersenbacteria bacterium]
MTYQSWGQYPHVKQSVEHLFWRTDPFPEASSVLPFGQGRSYGDVNLNDGGTVVSTQLLNRFISFDTTTGILRAESGVTVADILQLVIPHGWFMPVSSGTKFVSLGGVIANDVHGKNHHRVGSFGCHVTQFELLRSDNTRLICSQTEHPDYYRATIGGLGLTGIITWAEIQLTKIPSLYLDSETIKVGSLEEFVELSRSSDTSHEHTVGWIDMSVSGKQLGRGLFMRANWAKESGKDMGDVYRAPKFTMPVNAPNWLISLPVIKAFNLAYYHKQLSPKASKQVHYDPFFYPLDVLQYWNRLYGSRGFQSFQAVIPHDQGVAAIRTILETVHKRGLTSPLTVLKIFGEKASPGMMSFSAPGLNILFDFPNVPGLNDLLEELDTIVINAGGKVNPAKDAHMSAKAFQTFYPRWQEFQQYIDPKISSSFWRRVTKN